MSRKTIIWIVAGVLAAAVVAAVGMVSYHVGFDHGAGRVVVGPRGALRGFGLGAVVTRRDAAFPAFGAFLALLIGGIIGAAITYLARPGASSAGAMAGGTLPATAVPTGYAAPPAAGLGVDPRWQQFEEWHRYAHSPASPAGAAAADPYATTAPQAGAPPADQAVEPAASTHAPAAPADVPATSADVPGASADTPPDATATTPADTPPDATPGDEPAATS